jgi:outer membrane murein-binding lipoprotein Lpp
MDAQQQLFGLMALAEEQQKAVKAAIDGLAKERNAIAPAIRAAVKDAVGTEARAALGAAATEASAALERIAAPLVAGAGAAEGRMNQATADFRRGWLFVAGLTTLCMVVGFFLILLTGAAYGKVMVRHISDLNEKRTALTAEIEQLTTELDTLKDRAAKAKPGHGR